MRCPTVRRMHVQLATDSLGIPLREATFVVVDLETTGGSPADAGITEIGAVKLCQGEVIGEFATLVNPGIPIPAFIASLTGITNALVADAPRLGVALPSFLEFIRGSILVAHNAPYDIGFLKGACAKHQQPWPTPTVIDTARLARVTLHRDEVRNCKLSTLAAHFRTTVVPSHRAFDDARATADVLHALLERVGDFGVTTVEDLSAFTSRVSPQQRAKRHLADGLPDGPGVYVFRDAAGQALYVGKSKSIRTRVRSYFTAAETRRRMTEMVQIATAVTPIPCSTEVEAHVREVRLIVSEQPRYNRRSRRPQAQAWLKITTGPAPRLSVVRAVRPDGAGYLGPFASSPQAQAAAEAITAVLPLRTCSLTIRSSPTTDTPGCALAELGRCLAPCTSSHDRAAYADLVGRVRRVFAGELHPVSEVIVRRMGELSELSRFEEAAAWRDRLTALALASVRTHRMRMLALAEQVVAARPTTQNGWEVHCIRFGRLAGAITVPPGVDPRPAVEALVSAAEFVARPDTPTPAGLTEEASILLDWLESDGVRLVRVSGPLAMPLGCGGALAQRLSQARHGIPAGSSLPDARWIAEYSGGSSARPVGPRDPAVSRIRTA